MSILAEFLLFFNFKSKHWYMSNCWVVSWNWLVTILCLWQIAGRAWVRGMWVNNLPGIKSSVMPQRLLQISFSPLCFQNGSISSHVQSSGSISLIQTSLMIWKKPVGKAHPTNFKKLRCDGTHTRPVTIFKCFRAAATSAYLLAVYMYPCYHC